MQSGSIEAKGEFENLEFWQRTKSLAVSDCREAEFLRSVGLREQIVRSALSASSNIADGAERNFVKEFVRFLGYARNFADELRTKLIIGSELRCLSKEQSASSVHETIKNDRKLAGPINFQQD